MSHFMSWMFTWRLKKIITPHNESLSCLCFSAIGSSKFVYFKRLHLFEVAMKPSFQPWKMSLILLNLHYTWTKHATFLWQTFIVLCFKRNLFIIDSVGCLGNCLIWKINMREKTFTLHGWTQMIILKFEQNKILNFRVGFICLLKFSCSMVK